MLVLIIFALLLTGCSDNKAAPVNRQAQAAPVYISKAVLKSVPIEIETVGNVEAYSTVLVKANIAADQAALDRAKLQLEYCTIRSPIDGRTGHLIVKQGNVIKANDVDLVTINQLLPIYVTFTVPETNLQLIKTRMAAGNVFVEAE